MKFLRTIRLDPSDTKVFPHAAEPGEWAVPGTFAFADVQPENLSRKEQLAFKSGWLGTDSFGRSTFVQVVDISDRQFEDVVQSLAAHFVDAYGAPDLPAALGPARDEASYAAELAQHRGLTLLAMERDFTDQGVSERVSVVTPKDDGLHARIWDIVDDED
jgi:hypothetical protein